MNVTLTLELTREEAQELLVTLSRRHDALIREVCGGATGVIREIADRQLGRILAPLGQIEAFLGESYRHTF